MSYREILRSLGAATERKVMVAHAALNAGTIQTEAEFINIVASIIAKANGSAVALADLSLAATLTLELRAPVAAQGLLPLPATRSGSPRAWGPSSRPTGWTPPCSWAAWPTPSP